MISARYVSGPIPLPRYEDEPEFERADLEFRGVDHSGASFEARVFINNPEADEQTPRTSDAGYAGSFFIFGHGGCFGEVGHCDVPSGPIHSFDRRRAHGLTPQDKIVVVTDVLKQLIADGAEDFTVTVVAVVYEPDLVDKDSSDVLKFDRLSVATYE